MYCVYVLKSRKDGKLYIGFTNDLKRRLLQHNSGDTKSTRYRSPFILVYSEIYRSKLDALTRERRLKHFKNSCRELVKRIDKSLELA